MHGVELVNTTSRIESTGEGGRIHVSQEFANDLIKRGKSDWVSKRQEVVEAKGKGALTTYWLRVIEADGRSSLGSSFSCALTAPLSTSSDTPNPRLRLLEVPPLSTVEETSSPLTQAACLAAWKQEPPTWDEVSEFNDEMSV